MNLSARASFHDGTEYSEVAWSERSMFAFVVRSIHPASGSSFVSDRSQRFKDHVIGGVDGQIERVGLSMNTVSSVHVNALDLLDELDARHDKLLDDLDGLLSRVEGVLEEYARSRGKPPDTYKAKSSGAFDQCSDTEVHPDGKD